VAKSKFFENPMHCSGLALARANVTLEAWQRGEAPPVENDGIVTAEDVAALDLKGTWLVTLSACDSGSGETKAGEGVLGLRRDSFRPAPAFAYDSVVHQRRSNGRDYERFV
jgi:hypothetical protein